MKLQYSTFVITNRERGRAIMEEKENDFVAVSIETIMDGIAGTILNIKLHSRYQAMKVKK